MIVPRPRFLYGFLILCIAFALLVSSTDPVKVYQVQGIAATEAIGGNRKEKEYTPPEPSWWSRFFQQISILALVGLAGGAIAGVLSGGIHKELWMKLLSGATAGLLAGVLLGSMAYLWEYSFGYDILNNIYELPEKAIDFTRE